MSVWGHHYFHIYPRNHLICRHVLLTYDVVKEQSDPSHDTSVLMCALPHNPAQLNSLSASTARSLSLKLCLKEWITPHSVYAFIHLFKAAEAELPLHFISFVYDGNKNWVLSDC